ncbi:MAG: xanthine dehydrogenase small subunit [bacterium]
MIRFLLNKREVALQSFAADTTVLDYLRNAEGKCGTKEGCASGDCGACTVVVASPAEVGLHYQSINSCITFLGALHGKQLITVEDLAEGDQLHPVQQAMVDNHGSQCGFCTPGFVMSMFALYKNVASNADNAHKHHATHEFLAGNLCRCTGYRPIVDAALKSVEQVQPDQFDKDKENTKKQLLEIMERNASPDSSGTSAFKIPHTLSELSSMYTENPGARLLGGGTDLALEVTQQLKQQDTIILLQNVDEMHEVEQIDNTLEIGAAVSLSECDKLLRRRYPAISELLKRFGSSQVRNQGTIGGNIANASPIGDLPPVLISLNARLRLQQGQYIREVPVQEFFIDYRKTLLKPGEFLSTVILPLPTSDQIFRVYKVSKRLDDDISAVCMAINVSLNNADETGTKITSARIALGGMAAIPKRAFGCESILIGADLNDKIIDKAGAALGQDFSPISDARASADYRIQVAQNLLRRFKFEVTENGIETRVEHVA